MTARPSRRGGVIFDVDGTLLDTNYLHVAAWREAAALLGNLRASAIGRLGASSAGQVRPADDGVEAGIHSGKGRTS